MNYLKKCYIRFLRDRMVWGNALLNFLLSVCFVYFYVDSGRLVFPLLYLVLFITSTFCLFFFGRKVIPFSFAFFCYISIQDMYFRDCTLFFILLGLIYYFPKFKYFLIVIYTLDVLLVCFRHDKTVWHLLAHISFCLVFYLVTQSFISDIKRNAYKDITKGNRKLNLTNKELTVITTLIEGKPLKSIEGMSKNMPKKYIESACKRNNCSGKDELLALYKLQTLIND